MMQSGLAGTVFGLVYVLILIYILAHLILALVFALGEYMKKMFQVSLLTLQRHKFSTSPRFFTLPSTDLCNFFVPYTRFTLLVEKYTLEYYIEEARLQQQTDADKDLGISFNSTSSSSAASSTSQLRPKISLSTLPPAVVEVLDQRRTVRRAIRRSQQKPLTDTVKDYFKDCPSVVNSEDSHGDVAGERKRTKLFRVY